MSADLQVADAASWQPSVQYDLITSGFALPVSQADQLAAMRMMKNALAPGGTLVLKDFDATMRKPKRFAGFHLPTVDELTTAFEIVRAEVVETPVHHHAEGDHANERWTAAILVARRRG